MQQSKEQDALLSSAESRNSYSLKGPSTPSIGSVFSPNGNSKGSNGAGSNTSAHFKGQVSTPGSLNRSRDSYLGAMTPDSRKKFYKGTSNMSTTAFQTMVDAMTRQREAANSIVRSRSRSVTANSQHGEVVMSEQEKHIVEQEGRKALYGSLPMVSAFGMHNRESSMRQVINAASFNAMESLVSSKYAVDDDKVRLLDDVDVDELIVTPPLMLAVLVAVTLQFTLGYNTAVMNSPADVVFPGHSTSEWALAVSAFAVGGPFGALIGGQLADERGRRGAILITAWIFFVGGVLMTTAPSVWWLVPARLVVGFASGVSSVVVPVYLGEVAPPTLRGTLGTLTQFAMVIGILVSGLLGFPLATESRWRFLFAVTPLLCLAQIAVSPFLLESPRWLLGKDDDSVEARIVIKKLRGFRSDDDVEIQHFLFAASQHRVNSRVDNHSSTAVWHLIEQRHLRQLAASAIVLQLTQQLSGINAMFYYSTSFFEGVIDSPLLGTNLVALVNVLATYAALRLMDTTGRRTLLLWSIGGMLASTACIIGALTKILPNSAALLAVMSFVGFFEIGLGPVPWLVVAEMFDAKYVATAMSVACVVNWLCNFAVGLGFPYLQLYLGAFSFLPFAVVLTLGFVFVWLELPETHGRTVEELHTLLQTEYALKDLDEVRILPGMPVFGERDEVDGETEVAV